MRVLLVEDSRPAREAIAGLLRSRGHAVVDAGSVAHALLCSPTTVDVALVDLYLGDGSGIQVIKALGRTIPCLLFTVSERSTDLLRGVAAGARGYLLKSDPPATVLAALEQAVAGGMPVSADMTPHLLAPLARSRCPYTLDVDLDRGRARLADASGTQVSYDANIAVSLLYALGATWLRRPGTWMDDELLASSIWGRAWRAQGPNNLNVAIHRVRRKARDRGLDHAFLLKENGRTRLDVAAVVGPPPPHRRSGDEARPGST